MVSKITSVRYHGGQNDNILIAFAFIHHSKLSEVNMGLICLLDFIPDIRTKLFFYSHIEHFLENTSLILAQCAYQGHIKL